MPASFFTIKNDGEFLGASAQFSAAITLSPTSYGLVAGQATSYAAKHAVFAAALTAIGNKSTKNAALVIAKNDARAEVVSFAVELSKIVDGTVSVTDEQRAELGLNVRATPTPIAPPGTATGFVASLPGNGDLSFKWKCENPKGSQGTMYNVWRKIDAEIDYTFIGGVGAKKFTDTTLPAGATNVTYKVQAVRSTAAGDWGTFVVDFGKNAAGATTATLVEPAAKLAA